MNITLSTFFSKLLYDRTRFILHGYISFDNPEYVTYVEIFLFEAKMIQLIGGIYQCGITIIPSLVCSIGYSIDYCTWGYFHWRGLT